jgi:hypothetical protein
MRTIDIRKQQMFVRVRDFGMARRETFPAASPAGKLFAAVAAAADALEQQLSSNPGGRGAPREGITAKAVARQALRRRLSTIATMARALALDTPDLADKFKIPLNCGEVRFLLVARSFADNSRPLAKLFVAQGMPSNFLSALEEEIEALATATVQVRAGRQKARTIRSDIDATIARGVRAVVKLNAVIRSALHDDRAALASWEEARWIDYSARRRNLETSPPGGPPQPAGAPAPASAPLP